MIPEYIGTVDNDPVEDVKVAHTKQKSAGRKFLDKVKFKAFRKRKT